jgi:hypothetical protein
MSEHIAVPPYWAAEIKQLALRFAKELEKDSNVRIRGRKLYDAFAKPLGYDSFNELVTQSKRHEKADFDFEQYFIHLVRTLRKHLPVLLTGDQIILALHNAKSPGHVVVGISNHLGDTPWNEEFYKSSLLKCFLDAVQHESRTQHVSFDGNQNYGFLGLDNHHGAVAIVLDYRQWKNETDPLMEWPALNEFIRPLFKSDTPCVFIKIPAVGQPLRLVAINSPSKLVWEKITWMAMPTATVMPEAISEETAKAIMANTNPAFRLPLKEVQEALDEIPKDPFLKGVRDARNAMMTKDKPILFMDEVPMSSNNEGVQYAIGWNAVAASQENRERWEKLSLTSSSKKH